MKKIFSTLALAVALSTAFVSCNQDDNSNEANFDVNGGQMRYLFIPTGVSELSVNNESVTTIEIPVGVTTVSGTDRTIGVSVDAASSTAPANSYTLTTTSVTIPAGSFQGVVSVSGNFENVPEEGVSTIVLKLDVPESEILDDKGTHTINVFRSCPTDSVAGMYSVTTTYTVHDFLPDFATYTMETEVTAVAGQENTFRVADFSGGLYSVGPYNDAYGTGSAGQANNIDLVFTISCGVLTWSGQNDPYGAINMQGTNSYDASTGVITISWNAVGYNETGVSVYTPL
ncbi:MAG: hypothetical protein EON97_00485 [Chitinophagaceae bacterium]|nr:MAG: hypothetical protein EON97_00485 [Chitinophagaceae bacterium]